MPIDQMGHHASVRVLISRKAAADRLSISLRMLDYLIANRKLATTRIGRRVLIPTSAINKLSQSVYTEVNP